MQQTSTNGNDWRIFSKLQAGVIHQCHRFSQNLGQNNVMTRKACMWSFIALSVLFFKLYQIKEEYGAHNRLTLEYHMFGMFYLNAYSLRPRRFHINCYFFVSTFHSDKKNLADAAFQGVNAFKLWRKHIFVACLSLCKFLVPKKLLCGIILVRQ